MRNKSIQTMTKIALLAAIIAVCSIISFPLPSGVPVTLQTFAVALAGFTLGWKFAPAAVAVYLTIGSIGVPVFAGFKSGFSVLFGVTGGYLWGFIFTAALCGLAMGKGKILTIICSACGLAVCHLLGVIQFAFVSGSSPLSAFLLASAPYLIKDLVSVAAAYMTAMALRKAMKYTKA